MDNPNDLSMDLAIELACIANSRDNFDIEKWANNVAVEQSQDLGELLQKFLQLRIEDEQAYQRNEIVEHRIVPLSVKTVHSLLLIIEKHISDAKLITEIQRSCLQIYPRLINYGEGFDDIIEFNSAHGNSLPETVEKLMQDLFGKMYRGELTLRQIIEFMRHYKSSRDPFEQDLFICMIHGLIDEYNCYPTYPIDALTKAAVLFGGLINFRLVSGITLKVCLGMILDAVRDRTPDDAMFKFGVEAIEQIVSRLPEWTGFCNLLLRIRTLHGTPIHGKAEEVIRNYGASPHKTIADDINYIEHQLPNGQAHGSIPAYPPVLRPFRAIFVDPPLRPEIYRNPSESVHDKILFILNNLSESNLEEKFADLKTVLLDEHHQWFATYLVEERAKMEPNYQGIYLHLLDLLNDKMLWAEVLRETLNSSAKSLNSVKAIHSTIERGHLKNLGGWLGSLTIARDKPIKHKNIYFKDLLLEAYDTDRLMVAIPFTCKVLLQSTKSTVFKVPNPWLMDILTLLVEIYHHADIKMLLKFEIEVLCKDLHLDVGSLEASNYIRGRLAQTEEALSSTASMPEGLEGFSDLSLLNRGGMPATANPRLSPTTVLSSMSNLDQLLVFPPSVNNLMIDTTILRQIVHSAVERAISEIIAPVVERSITIASISTAQLICKDFAMEPDETKLRRAACAMVSSLAGSLALVTCKEPLKMSMTNYIRVLQQEIPEQPIPETLIITCVNSNLDAACGIVEKAAEEKSVPEIEKVLEPAMELRRRHRVTHPSEPFMSPAISRWGFCIPEPYRRNIGGLNAEQVAVYDNFARDFRRNASVHMQPTSSEATVQPSMPEILQVPSLHNLTPADDSVAAAAAAAGMPRAMLQAQHDAAIQQAAIAPGQLHPQSSYLDANPSEKLKHLVLQLQQSARNASSDNIKDLARDPAILQDYNNIIRCIIAGPTPHHGEAYTRIVALAVCNILHDHTESKGEIEVLVHLLSKLCDLSPIVAKDVCVELTSRNDDKLFSVATIESLVTLGLLDLHRVDAALSMMIAVRDRNNLALEFLLELLEHFLLNDDPAALRSDFAHSLEAMSEWYAEDRSLKAAPEIIRRMRESGYPEFAPSASLNNGARIKQDQMEYIFSEWIGIYKVTPQNHKKYTMFLKDLHQQRILDNQEDSALFFRLCIDMSVAMFDRECQIFNGTIDEAFLYIDALARLIIVLVKFQSESDEKAAKPKAQYLKSILSVIVLVLNHHQVTRGEGFNQRVFFRLFSSLLCEYVGAELYESEQNIDMMLVFADTLLAVQPRYSPAFVFGWVSLVAHRVFLGGMLSLPNQTGWKPFSSILHALLTFVNDQFQPSNPTFIGKELYKASARLLLVIKHDFPDFVNKCHPHFCSVEDSTNNKAPVV